MLNEAKILFDNIKNFRHLITEAANEGDMEKYLNNHEYVYIYYAGDGKNQRGYRTIAPYVLGTNTSGNLVVRAWQGKGKSADFMNKPTRTKSFEHDFWYDNKGKEVAGWRMFRMDKIEKVYPTGEKFNNNDGTVMIPPKYKEGSDADIPNIIAYVSTKTRPVEPVEPEVSGTTKPTQQPVMSWGNANTARITPDDIIKLRNKITNVYKEAVGNFYVAVNGRGEFVAVRQAGLKRVPKTAIVGSLNNLYDKLVKANAQPDQKFFSDIKQKFDADLKNNKPENTESPTIPFEKKSFFKQ